MTTNMRRARGLPILKSRSASVSASFSPGIMIGFLTASLLETVRQTGLQMVEQAQIANTDFWNWPEEPPPVFVALLALAEELQERVFAGFELLARK